MIRRIKEPTVVTGPAGEVVKVVWLPGQRVRFDIKPGPAVIEAAFLQAAGCNVQVRYGIKNDIRNDTRVTAASVVTKLLSLSRVPPNAEIIKTVLSTVPGSHFNPKQLAWYKTQYRHGRLAGQTKGKTYIIAQGR